MTSGGSPEIEFLLCCAAPQGAERHARRIVELLDGGLDWERTLDLAEKQGVAPLVYWTLNSVRPQAIPARLTRRFQLNTSNSIHLTAELLRLVDLLSAAGIRVLPFKGPTLAMLAYGNLALRQFVDLDILVPREDALRAKDLLLANGYSSELQLSPRRVDDYLATYDEFVLRNADGLMVELHWGITPAYFSVPLNLQAFWKRVARVRLGQREVTSLCVEDLVTVLCVHGTKHCWSHLSLVSDLAWLLAAQAVSWQEVLRGVREVGALRMTLLGASLTERLLGQSLPEEVRRAVAADKALSPLVDRVMGGLFERGSLEGNMTGAAILHMKSRERWRDRLRYLYRMAAKDGIEDWASADLPPALSFLYVFLRFPRLLRKYGARIP